VLLARDRATLHAPSGCLRGALLACPCRGEKGNAVDQRYAGVVSVSTEPRWAGLDATEARAVGVMMNTRGLMELIVINVGYDLGVLPRSVFTMLVIMALISTVVTTPALRRWLRAQGVEEVKHGDVVR